MCTDFCICPGKPADAWVKEYEEKPDEYYAKFNRVKKGYEGKIDITRFSEPDPRPLFWNYDYDK